MNGGSTRAECILSGSLSPLVRGKNDPKQNGTYAWRSTGGRTGQWVVVVASRPETFEVRGSDGVWFTPGENPDGYGDPDHESKMHNIRQAIEINRQRGHVYADIHDD